MRFGWIVAVAVLSALAQTETAQSGEFRQHAFCLEYHRDFTSWRVPSSINRTSAAFDKEPPFDGREVHRRMLARNPDTDQSFGLAWDALFNVLHIDLNGNQDLTDDPAGAFPDCRGPDCFGEPIEFQLLFKTGRMPYHLEPRLALRRGWLHAAPLMRSGWVGRFELHGTSWEMAYMDDMDGRVSPNDGLFLRPAPTTDTPFDPLGDQVLDLAMARHLHLNGVLYDVDLAFEHGGPAPRLHVTLTERQDRPMGELLITGSSIRRIILRDQEDSTVVILDDPAPCVTVPAGTYAGPMVCLDPGDSLRRCTSSLRTTVIVEECRQTELAAGAPLRHAVSVDTHGSTLRVSSRLLGVGGESYHPTDRANGRLLLPCASIRHRGRQVASGAMRFGMGGAYSYSWRVPLSVYGPMEVGVSGDAGDIPLTKSPPATLSLMPRHPSISVLYCGIVMASPWLVGVLAPGLAILVLLRRRGIRRLGSQTTSASAPGYPNATGSGSGYGSTVHLGV
jgi:hypothetical protein